MCDNPIDVFVYTYAHVCMNIYVWFDVCARARISPSEKKKKCKFLLILTLYALCVYMSCKYIYIYMHICICIYMHINIIYIHTYVYILVYIYMYTYIFMHFCLTCQKPQFEDSQNSFRFILDSPNDFQKFVCRSLQYFSFYRMRRGYNRTRNPIDSVFIILSFTFYLFFFFFFFCIVHYIIIMSFFRRFTVYYRIVLRQRSFSKYRMQIISMNRNILFSLLHYFPSLRIVLRLAKTKKKKRKKVVHAQI